jgi:hypothetical protein
MLRAVMHAAALIVGTATTTAAAGAPSTAEVLAAYGHDLPAVDVFHFRDGRASKHTYFNIEAVRHHSRTVRPLTATALVK